MFKIDSFISPCTKLRPLLYLKMYVNAKVILEIFQNLHFS